MTKQYIFAGFGGQGMLLIGKFLAMASMLEGKHVSWLPSYGPEMRGGTANCSVTVSDEPVASPMVEKADTIIAMNRPSLDKFESHVKPGGVLAVITFHSLEDRIVKERFRLHATDCICPPRQPVCTCGHKADIRLYNRRPITAEAEELADNPRSRSANLRAAIKL